MPRDAGHCHFQSDEIAMWKQYSTSVVCVLQVAFVFFCGPAGCLLSPHQDIPLVAPVNKNSTLQLDHSILDYHKLPFIPHEGEGPFDSYLVLNIPFAPIDHLRGQIEKSYSTTLKHRGEAHITVITPPEYQHLSNSLSISRINELVRDTLQQTGFSVKCLGRQSKLENNKSISTWFVVVDAPKLVQIRRVIETEYLKKGGSGPAFSEPYYPHITIGFTDRDLYASDGALKGTMSCVADLEIAAVS